MDESITLFWFLMDHLKAYIRYANPDMTHVLTYANNFAVGYFEG